MFDRCLYFNVNALARVVNKKWAKAFDVYGISPAHGYLLRVVLANPGILQKHLGKELKLEKSTITRFVDALQKKGLVIRKSSSDDARELGIYATKEAKAIHSELENLGNELYQTMTSAIGEDNLKKLVSSLRQSADEIK